MLPASVQDDAAAMTQDVEEMDRLIAAYLAFARGEGTSNTPPPTSANWSRKPPPRPPRRQVDLVVPAEPLVLPVRADALRRCLGNLLDNARKHARRIAIGLTAVPREESGSWAMVTVDDDGPGLAEDQREEAFRPFATFSAGGFPGLGLAIARDIARAWRGHRDVGQPTRRVAGADQVAVLASAAAAPSPSMPCLSHPRRRATPPSRGSPARHAPPGRVIGPRRSPL